MHGQTFFEKHRLSRHPAQDLVELGRTVVDALRPILDGAILTGSLAYRAEGSDLRRDLDLHLIADEASWPAILRSRYLPSAIDPHRMMHWRQQDRIEMVGIRSIVDGKFIDAKIMSLATLTRICADRRTEARVYREETKDKGHQLLSFDGSRIAIPIKNVMVAGTGNAAHRTSVIEVRAGRFYSGSLHNQLFSAPRILYDRDGAIRYCLKEITRTTVQRFLTETAGNRPVDDLFNILLAANKLPGATRERMRYDFMRELESAGMRLHHGLPTDLTDIAADPGHSREFHLEQPVRDHHPADRYASVFPNSSVDAVLATRGR